LSHYGGKELADSFRVVRGNTITIAKDLPEDKFSFRAAPDTRSVGELFSHIALAHEFQYQINAVEKRSTLVGFDFPALMQRMRADEKVPRTKEQILELLQSSGEKWAGWLEGLTDDFLAERVSFPAGGPQTSKTRFEMVLGVKEHEMHHRGQLMLIERIVGIVPHLTRQMQERRAAAPAKP
jgi:uncharacterized damage-inducible protein DinB